MSEYNHDTEYEGRPIIVLGVGHSGTRVVVDILGVLGSDGGDCVNQWRENEFFLELHRDLLNVLTQEEWTQEIFRLDTYFNYSAPEENMNIVRNKLSRRLHEAYPGYQRAPWHWKCPTSALFMEFWMDVFPEAYYVHIVRDPLDVAGSLLRRKQFPTIRMALLFFNAMEDLIIAKKPKNYLRIDYAHLKSEVPRLLEFLPFLEESNMPLATELIHEGVSVWKKGAPLRINFTNLKVATAIRVAKMARSIGLYRNIKHTQKVL
jgi:hypothetical protein